MNRPSFDLPSLWWVPGLAAHERMPDGPPPGVPGWARWIEQAVGAPWSGEVDAAAEPAFVEIALPLRGLVEQARDQLTHEIARIPGIDVEGIGGEFAEQLAGRLAGLAARALVTELKRAKVAGETSRERFLDFVGQLSDPVQLGALLAKYPVLARLLGQACAQAVAYRVELVRRFDSDRAAIVEELLDGDDPGPLMSIGTEAGDAHQRGRSVAVLRFAGGRTVVYKPRCQRVQALFGEVVDWFNTRLPEQLKLRVPACLPRQNYGWLEFIEHRPVAAEEDVDRFYRRLGALLALLYAVDATDVHYDNLIACADQPVLVDVETLFHPHLPPAMIADPDPAMTALDSSVYRTVLLPQFQVGEHGALDRSGMGGDAGTMFPLDQVTWEAVGTDRMRLVRAPAAITGAANRPRLDGHDVEPAEYLPSLLDGFRSGYDAIIAGRDELLGLLQRFAVCPTRLVARSTQLYATLLSESTHPDLLRDGLDRDRVFDVLRQDAHGPIAPALLRHEIVDLWAGDVPLFTVRPGSVDIWTSTGRNVPNLLSEPGLEIVRRKAYRLSELDRGRQEWLITAAIGARTRITEGHRSGPAVAGRPVAMAHDPQRLLVEACGIADEIIAMAVHDDRRANWVGMELVDGRYWAVQPMGAGLANGYTGVALFLAQLGKLTGTARYIELARQAIRPLPHLIDAMAAKPEIARAVGPGGFLGLGGIGYALSRITRLDPDSGWHDCLNSVIELVAGCADDDQSDLTFGRAGGLAAMVAIYRETGIPAARVAARELADQLTGQSEPKTTRPGFAMGPAGVAFALARFAKGPGRYLDKARSILLDDLDPTNPAWCTGTSGTLLARAALARHDADTEELDRAVAVLGGQRPPVRDMSLCHGELGALDALAVLAGTGHQASIELLPQRTAQVYAILANYGPRCGTPNGVPSPGLLTGLAGIGYGLLRLGFPECVPSVLLFEPGEMRFG